MGIETALDLAHADPATLRRRFSVVLERTARELRGIACLAWEDTPPAKKQIMCSRSFGRPIQALSDLEEAVGHYTARATEKLRKGQLYAGELMVFIRTNPFQTAVSQYSRSASVRLVTPTQDSRVITRQAVMLLRSLYRDGFDYAKAGVMLSELVGGMGLQTDLFETPSEDTRAVERAARLMAVMDDINRKSRATVTMAREAGPGVYSMRRNHLSPAYTTSWGQLPEIY